MALLVNKGTCPWCKSKSKKMGNYHYVGCPRTNDKESYKARASILKGCSAKERSALIKDFGTDGFNYPYPPPWRLDVPRIIWEVDTTMWSYNKPDVGIRGTMTVDGNTISLVTVDLAGGGWPHVHATCKGLFTNEVVGTTNNTGSVENMMYTKLRALFPKSKTVRRYFNPRKR